MKRVMCVYLPRWPLQHLGHVRPELRAELVVLAQPRSLERAKVILCCDRAVQVGIRPGMPVAEARAMEPTLVVQDENPERDRRALEHLAIWAERFSPRVGLEESATPECLLLDITGCASCFHGEDRLIQRALHELREQGWSARAAIADTIGAAWALAHQARSWIVVPAGGTEKMLLPLPLAALRLPEPELQSLGELGIERIEHLHALPRSTLPGRFGPLVLRRLDQALGRQPELIVPHRVPPDVQARCSFEYPTDRRELLAYAMDQLLERLTATLQQRNRGARQLECWFTFETARPLRIEVGLFRPSRCREHLGKLLHTRLEQVRIEEPVRGICLHVPDLEILPQRQGELFETGDWEGGALSTLIDQLVSRLGREAITFARLLPDPQPEYACRFEPAISSARSQAKHKSKSAWGAELFEAPTIPGGCRRPVQLQPTPTRIEVLATVPQGAPSTLRWSGEEHAVVRCWGPERIETGWWRGQDIQRDYYKVQTDRGARLWIFRRPDDGRWFLHGCFE